MALQCRKGTRELGVHACAQLCVSLYFTLSGPDVKVALVKNEEIFLSSLATDRNAKHSEMTGLLSFYQSLNFQFDQTL